MLGQILFFVFSLFVLYQVFFVLLQLNIDSYVLVEFFDNFYSDLKGQDLDFLGS